jgi:hypothetical protein
MARGKDQHACNDWRTISLQISVRDAAGAAVTVMDRQVKQEEIDGQYQPTKRQQLTDPDCKGTPTPGRIRVARSISTESMLMDRHLKWHPLTMIPSGVCKHVSAAHEEWKKMYSKVVDGAFIVLHHHDGLPSKDFPGILSASYRIRQGIVAGPDFRSGRGARGVHGGRRFSREPRGERAVRRVRYNGAIRRLVRRN